MPSPGQLLYAAYTRAVYIPILGLVTVVLAITSLMGSFLLGPRAGAFSGLLWSHLMMGLIPMRVTVRGAARRDPAQSYVVVSNHLSHVDTWALLGWLDYDLKFVMKQELRRVPFFGIACEKMGHVFVDRSSPRAAIASLATAKRKIRDGRSILFFPEGTRGNGRELRPFKKGAFHMALDLGIPILPLTIRGSNRVLPPRTIALRPGTVELIVHEPIPVAGSETGDAHTLAQQARAVIEASWRDQAP